MTSKKSTPNPLWIVLPTWFICFIFRALEFLVLKTDQTFFGEAVVHSLIGIVMLILIIILYPLNGERIGLTKTNILSNFLKGMLFSLITFGIAYTTEIIILNLDKSFVKVDLYITSYSVNGQIGQQRSIIFFLICILVNIVNVLMEEGMFRGLFQTLLNQWYQFMASSIIAALLFGFWHIIGPFRNFWEGTVSANGFVDSSIMFIGISIFVGLKFSLITKLTGNLYMAMGDHFLNNTLLDMFHIISTSGSDSYITIRILIAQTLSFGVVFVFYLIRKYRAAQAC